MRAILIDTQKKQVSEVDLPKENRMDTMYRLMHCETCDFSTALPERDRLVVDENGIFSDSNLGFELVGIVGVYFGDALIIGLDENGHTVDCKADPGLIRVICRFLDRNMTEEVRQVFKGQSWHFVPANELKLPREQAN